MDMPPWHIGHVIKKLMMAREPEITRTQLATRAGKRPMTITHLLKGGKSDPETIDAVCAVLEVSPADLYMEVERSNAGRPSNVFTMQTGEPRRRVMDRDPQEVDAEQYARRLLRLANSAQTAVYNAIRAFEEAYGLLKNTHER